MEKIIYADQVLHGYANGHQLLASSCALELADRKKMDELSDLSGRHSGENFVDYYTGYPIEDGKRYVISKTWYAHEMMRPGCVWTHSLIFHTEELCRLSDFPKFIDSFRRPVDLNYEVYMQPISLCAEDKKCFPPYDVHKLQYEIFTICSSAAPKYVTVDAASVRLENELFMVLCSLPQEILRKFTFCTMSYDIRKYGDALFQYQIIPDAGRNYLIRYYTQAVSCEDPQSIKKYPYWIQCYMHALLQDELGPLYDFIRQYGTDCVTLERFSQFSRLYFALIGETEISLAEYIDSADVLFPSDRSISQKTVDLVLDDKFFPEIFENQEYQILGILEMKHILLEKTRKKKLVKKITGNTPGKLYPYLKRYIAGELPTCTCEYVEDIIQALSPSDLQKVSHMERNICFVLVRRNPALLLCPDIWQQSRDFQQEIICAISQNLQQDQLTNLLFIVLRIDTENIAEDLYRAFGEQLFPALYSAFSLADLSKSRNLDYWTPILLRNQRLLIEELLNLPDMEWRRELFLKLNMTKDGLAQTVKKDLWLRLFHEFFETATSARIRLNVAIQFFPAVFCTYYHFEDDFIREVVGTVYREVKADTIGFDAWNRYQDILPQVEDFQAWDRCLRIRRALEQKKYPVSLVE